MAVVRPQKPIRKPGTAFVEEQCPIQKAGTGFVPPYKPFRKPGVPLADPRGPLGKTRAGDQGKAALFSEKPSQKYGSQVA